MQENRREISIIKKRIMEYLDERGISKYECYKNTGISRSVLSQVNGMTEDNLLKFLAYYKEVNPRWLLTGQGNMLIDDIQPIPETSSSEVIIYHTICKEKDAKIEAQAEEIGRLKERLNTQDKKLKDLQLGKTFRKGSISSTPTRKSDVAGLEDAHLGE